MAVVVVVVVPVLGFRSPSLNLSESAETRSPIADSLRFRSTTFVIPRRKKLSTCFDRHCSPKISSHLPMMIITLCLGITLSLSLSNHCLFAPVFTIISSILIIRIAFGLVFFFVVCWKGQNYSCIMQKVGL